MLQLSYQIQPLKCLLHTVTDKKVFHVMFSCTAYCLETQTPVKETKKGGWFCFL